MGGRRDSKSLNVTASDACMSEAHASSLWSEVGSYFRKWKRKGVSTCTTNPRHKSPLWGIVAGGKARGPENLGSMYVGVCVCGVCVCVCVCVCVRCVVCVCAVCVCACVRV